MQLFQINQSEESSKITINAHTPSCPLHELPITWAAHYRWITLVSFISAKSKRAHIWLWHLALTTISDYFLNSFPTIWPPWPVQVISKVTIWWQCGFNLELYGSTINTKSWDFLPFYFEVTSTTAFRLRTASLSVNFIHKNIPFGQSSAKLPVSQSLGHSITWSLGHLATWSLGHSVTWVTQVTRVT